MIKADPIYIARRQDDGTWSIVDIKTGRVADIGGCVLRRLDVSMTAGLVRDLNGVAIVVQEHAARDQVRGMSLSFRSNTAALSWSSRKPLYEACRRLPSPVQPRNSISAISVGWAKT